ncbi:hypothetical protein [Streptomyces sp. BPTC-684]|uniref:hypothetical protein n=1 Tax=Streptomyces sp. BPTC-684 TaxID=3043734 RepID=UPI0024B24D0D|nr:hypothetical protein [Streptomyces sp. BPTC-684]WHM37025.1 hypothetical protein QIY60_09040 [Streptomyces sp. BPTC-684]
MPMDMQEWRDSTATADNAANAFRDLLRLADAPDRTINSVRGAASHKGEALVYIGHLPANVVERLAERVCLEVTP